MVKIQTMIRFSCSPKSACIASRPIPSPSDPIEIVESPVDTPPPNHIPESELEESPLFVITPKIVHFATWTVQHGLSFRGSSFRPKCGAPIVPDAQVSPKLPKEVRFCLSYSPPCNRA